MRGLSFLFVIAALGQIAVAADFAPALQWVATIDSSGYSLMAAAGSDARGNLYITGATKSLDFPVTGKAGPVVTGLNPAIADNTDVFAVKLDNNGNVVYSKRFGGSGNDTAAALAVDGDGSLYVTGTTTSTDLPVTAGGYLTQFPSTSGSAANFVLKLNPDGSLAWATYFTGQAVVASIAVDSAGNPFVGGSSGGGLPTTPGAYQTTFRQSVTSNGFFAVIGPPAAFVTKLDAKGAGLLYSTYVPTDNSGNVVSSAQALVVDAAGNAWIGVGVNPGIVPSSPGASVVELNPAGSAVIASAVQPAFDSIAALALDASSNVYVAGTYRGFPAFPATPGAFQPSPQPAIPALPNQSPSGGGLDTFVAKWDSGLTHLLAATLLGGELLDLPTSIAIDASGMVVVAGYSDSKAFPTHAPFQASFSSRTGFVAGFDLNLSNLLFSTYAGDGRPFAAQSAIPDGRGNILLAGSTLRPGGSVVNDGSGAGPSAANLVFANRIALGLASAVRLDSVQNYASHIAGPLAPGETILATGAGFGSGAQIVLDGFPLATRTATATSIAASVPETAVTSGVHTLQVADNGTLSNSVYLPAAPAAPGIFAVDGSGAGQGYILNSDGTLNSPSNPAAPGSAITIFITGAGQYSLDHGYAVAAEMPAVFVDGFYCNGIAATIGAVDGLPGNVYRLSVYVPDPATLAQNNPDLKNFKFPAQSAIRLEMVELSASNSVTSRWVSQNGIFINIK